MIKQKRKRKSNQGNSFIVVVATISFLAVLVTALLVAVALCFRLKAYDMNSRDNFYYLEQAMDEIYEGVGSIAMEHLNAAYNETAEVLVYFDPAKESYVTMEDKAANDLMKATFISKLHKEDRLEPLNIESTLTNFIRVDDDNVGNTDITFSVSVDGVETDSKSGVVTLKNVVLKREAPYSTINTVKDEMSVPTTYVQSITTDLVIAPPDFDVNFALVGNDISELYDFVLISDMGVEINGIGTRSNITGNIYAAADFYNKDYNTSGSTSIVDTLAEPLVNKVNSYTDSQLEDCDGVSEKSMYSGFYVNGAKVSVLADKMIVPGSIAAMNCAELSVVGTANRVYTADGDDIGIDTNSTQIWADSVILGGYSRKIAANSDSFIGSIVNMKANAYIYDDLEVNATGSKFSLNGTYYGYNYATTDNRKYTKEFIEASTNRKYLSEVKINDGNYMTYYNEDGSVAGHLVGQAHYNSSAVIVNGEDATLDLSNVSSMYIAGQAYVELSKSAQSTTYEAKDDGSGETKVEVSDATKDEDKVNVDSYAYAEQSNENYSTITDETAVDENGDKKKIDTRIQDYRTGEGLTIKSNQLAYIPPYTVKEDEKGNIYVEWPKILTTTESFKDIWKDLSKVPVIKTVVSGTPYYFYDFSHEDANVTMNQYLEAYAQLFETDGTTRSIGDMADLYDITEYDAFKVNDVKLDVTNIYSNSAISVKRDGKVTIIADSKSVQPLLEAKKVLDNVLQPNVDVTETSTPIEKTDYAGDITIGLQKQYKEMKLLLTNTSTNADAVSYSYGTEESGITPINYYFDFEILNGRDETFETKAGYKVFLGEKDVEVSSENGASKIKGIVICKGDVTFDPSIKEFEGIIVAGGKIIANSSINFVSNPEIIKAILRECDESRTLATTDRSYVCSLFRHFVSNFAGDQENTTDSDIVAMKSITAIQYEDMLAFENWKKNVD